ncbi:MAG: ABC transporter permease [Candidimonas sp.]|nr:MAG: ABC transporter permease [Candidimonas sp.]TAM23489.1 MAG: ABC transporter permease [Candidimonas sp.]TAM73972.1 MAG: ABC transporter permease [Candidimonas sp.]
MPKIVFLWTDIFVFSLLLALLLYAFRVARTPALRATWASVARTTSAMCAAVVLCAFVLVGLLDSMHYRPQLPIKSGSTTVAYAQSVRSVLDDVLALTRLAKPEKTYSAPLALRQFTKENELVHGRFVRDYPRLQNAGLGLSKDSDSGRDIVRRLLFGLLAAVACAAASALLLTLAHRARANTAGRAWRVWWSSESEVPWRAMWLTFCVLMLVVCVTAALATNYHVLGTDRTGNDVLRQALKSVRTALIIGTLTTMTMLPPALIFGISAGYFKGRVDDIIQYIYTTLTSIPGVLLIAACVLMMQVYIDNNPNAFDTVAARADLRLFFLCLILGLTGWAGLCRLLRAETLKLRELDYVQAARAFGVSHWRIMRRHLLPNVMHIVLITMVLEFSSLVLYEAVLSYLGIGVDPNTPSFGTMIDSARLEMSRDPMIWWNLLTAFIFLLALVLAANIFADAVQDAFDPRVRKFSPAHLRRRAAQMKSLTEEEAS